MKKIKKIGKKKLKKEILYKNIKNNPNKNVAIIYKKLNYLKLKYK